MLWMNRSQLAGPDYPFSVLLLKRTPMVSLSGSGAHCGKGVEERLNFSECRGGVKTVDSFLCSVSTSRLTKSIKNEAKIVLSVYMGFR